MRNKKAQGSALIWKVIMILGVLIIAVVMIGFMIKFSILAPSRISAESCRWSLNIKHGWNDQVQDVTDQVDDNAHFLGWRPFKLLGDPIGDTIQEGGDVVKLHTDLCIENTQTICEGTADEVAKCIYRRAAETYYVLRGGLENTKWDFNLYEIIVDITGEGTLGLHATSGGNKKCLSYLRHGTGDSGTIGDLTYLFDSTTSTCNITSSVIGERIMTLAMIEECQSADQGPTDPDCKCFVDISDGYIMYNGLPNTKFITGYPGTTDIMDGHPNELNLGEYIPYIYPNYPGPPGNPNKYESYYGCGHEQPISPTRDNMGTQHDWNDRDMIVWDPEDWVVKVGEDEKLYTRIKEIDGIDKVVVSRDCGSGCDD
jgi:hypothetical protein